MTKRGIFSWFSFDFPIQRRLQMIRNAGFEAVSLWWGDENRQHQPDMARRLGLELDNVHAPFPDANRLWMDGLDGEDYLNTLLTCVSDCAQHDIPTVVVHITGFTSPPEITRIGVERVKRLVGFAEDKKVRLAFENLNFLQHLDYIFEHITSDYLGFCYDSGHENCFHPSADCLSRYGSKLFAVHLDDNPGNLDTHLLPYDGTVNWEGVKRKLKQCRDIRYLTLEVDFNTNHEASRIYRNLSADEYLALAYEKSANLEQPTDL
jgi:sugar phosphate isomerase/epimerase